jgi:hypothetical protein
MLEIGFLRIKIKYASGKHSARNGTAVTMGKPGVLSRKDEEECTAK